MIGSCFADENGGGTSGPPAYNPISEDGLDCSSFEFHSTAGNWQEAGVRNLRINFRWIGDARNGVSINITLGAQVVFGLPKVRQDGTTYSPGQAAMLAAHASDFAHAMTAQILKSEPYRPRDNVIEETYRKWMNLFMQNYGGTAGRTGSGSPQIIFKDATYKFLGNGNCE